MKRWIEERGGRRLSRIRVAEGYPAFGNSFGGLFSTPQADISRSMLASKLVAAPVTYVQTSAYA